MDKPSLQLTLSGNARLHRTGHILLFGMKQLDPKSIAARDIANGRYVVRSMSQEEIDEIIIPRMCNAGWNSGIHDASTFIVADSDGFFVGELDGKPIACVSAVRYDDSFAFFGCYLVDEAYRGYGYGMAAHEMARKHVVGCVQGGDAVLENIAKYEQIGRVAVYKNTRFEGVAPSAMHGTKDVSAIDIRSVDLQQIALLDRVCFPAPRIAFLRAWFSQSDGSGFAVMNGESVEGFGFIRKCFQGHKIGPLFAKTPTAADAIYRSLISTIRPGELFWLDVPEPNENALDLVKRNGMKEVFATMRTYTGTPPDLRLDWIYGITTFELG